ncbi:MAG TPA: fimbria/pilus outer membrane usher protein [Novosphingobium sp.]|nr:fimbria/pilus outer membrane usher protein [Novosphingobium sp.]
MTAALVAFLALSSSLMFGAAGAHAQEIASATEIPVGVVVNGQPIAEPGLVVVREGRILARRSDLEVWGLTAKAITATELLQGESYVALDRVKGLVARLDADGGTLHVQADAALFPRLAIDPDRRAVPVAAAVPAQFLDYDLTLSDWNGRTQVTGLVDAGFSGAWGVATSSFLVDSGGGQSSRGAVRLDTALRRDFPDRRMRLMVGDAVGSGAPWSRPVRYGGLFLGTDFSLDPQAINFPLPVISGSAVTPSTIELLSESSRRSLEVGPGAFDLSLQPRLTGAGQVTMSVRDLAGNIRQVTRNFYASPNLLRPGLSEFAIEAGALRRGFGFDSFGYGPLFAAAGLRRGITRTLTMEGRIEMSGATRMAGLGASMVIEPIAEFSVSGAVSQGSAGTGTLVRASAQRITPIYTLSASYERADAQFRQVGESRFNGGGRSEMVIAGGLSLGDLGSVNASYARLRQGTGGEAPTRFDLASAYYSTNLRGGYLSVGVQYTGRRFEEGGGSSAAKGSRNVGLFGSLTIPLGPRRHVSAIAEQGRAAVTFDQNLPEDTGMGMRALAGVDRGSAWLEGGVSYRTAAGDLRIDAAQRQGRQGVQVNARGGLLRIDKALMATQHIDEGFALVDVASDTPVTVLVENRPKPRKAGQGHRVIVTGLQPYAENHVAVDAADLSIEAGLDAQAQVVAPGWRQAVRVAFGSAGRQGARLRLVDVRGNPVQTGSSFAWTGGSGIVGYDGEIWIEDYAGGGAVLRVSGANGACRVVVPQLAGEARLAAAAPVTCVPENEWVKADHAGQSAMALADKEPRP